MEYYINSKFERSLEIRGGESIINKDENIMTSLVAGNFGNIINIDNFKHGVGGCFDPNEFSIGSEGLFNGFGVGHVNEGNFNVMLFLKETTHVSLSTSINIVTTYNMISEGEEMEDTSHGTTTTGKGETMGTILTSCQTILKGLSGGVGTSGIIEFGEKLGGFTLGKGGG